MTDRIFDGQTYRFVAEQPYIRTDGQPSRVLVFASHCAQCGREFEFKCSAASKFSPNRRCADHRAPGRRVRRRVR
jgi:hypothetical protein